MNLEELGWKLPLLVAGFAGGVVNAFMLRRANVVDVTGSLVVGMFTANYWTEAAVRYIGTPELPTAFLVGVCGMAIARGVFNAARRWRPSLPNGGGDGGS